MSPRFPRQLRVIICHNQSTRVTSLFLACLLDVYANCLVRICKHRVFRSRIVILHRTRQEARAKKIQHARAKTFGSRGCRSLQHLSSLVAIQFVGNQSHLRFSVAPLLTHVAHPVEVQFTIQQLDAYTGFSGTCLNFGKPVSNSQQEFPKKPVAKRPLFACSLLRTLC